MKSIALLPLLASFALVGARSQIVILDTTSSTPTTEYVFGRKSLDFHDYAAQSFTTPNEALTLSSVNVVLYRSGLEALYPPSITLNLLSDASNTPGAFLATLSGPGSFGPVGATATLTYTGSVSLAPNTTYWVQVDSQGEEVVKWWGTDSPVQTGVGTAGDISLLDLAYGYLGSWQNDSAHKLLVTVTAVPEPEKTALALSALPGAFALYRINKRRLKRRSA